MSTARSKPHALTINGDAAVVAQAFGDWQAALVEGGVREPRLWRLPEQRIVFCNRLYSARDVLETDFHTFTAVPDGKGVAVTFDPALLALCGVPGG